MSSCRALQGLQACASSRCQQPRQQQHVVAASLRSRQWAAAPLLLRKLRLPAALQQLPQAPRRCRAARASTTNIAATGGEGSSGSGDAAAAAPSGEAGTLQGLLRSIYDWLCRVKPPRTLWRSLSALVLGGQALVRILQGGWVP